MKHILFVCRFNCFRSQIAAGFFNKYCPKSIATAESAALIEGDGISKEVKEYAKNNKIKLTKPKGLKRRIVNAQDIFVIVADDVPPQAFAIFKKRGKNVIVWKIKDLWASKNFNKVDKRILTERTSSLIKNKVLRLIKDLEMKK